MAIQRGADTRVCGTGRGNRQRMLELMCEPPAHQASSLSRADALIGGDFRVRVLVLPPRGRNSQ